MARRFLVGAIEATLSLTTSPFIAGIRQATSILRSFGSVAASTTNLGVSGFRKFNDVVRGLLFPLRGLSTTLLSVRSATATFVAAFATSKFFTFTKALNDAEISFGRLTASLGESAPLALSKLQEATRGTISELKLLQQANQAISLGVTKNVDDLAKLAAGARRLGQATGRTPEQAFQDIALGIGRQSRLILDNIGIIVRAEDAYDKYAKALGKTRFELNANQKREAFLQASLKAIDVRLAALGPDMERFSDVVAQVRANFSNFFADISRQITPALQGLYEALRDIVRGDLADKIGASLATIINGFAKFVRENGPQVITLLTNISKIIVQIIAGLAKLAEQFASAFVRIANLSPQEFLDSFIDFIVTFAIGVVEGLGYVLAKVVLNAITVLAPAIATLIDTITEKIAQKFPAVFGASGTDFAKVIDSEFIPAVDRFSGALDDLAKKSPRLQALIDTKPIKFLIDTFNQVTGAAAEARAAFDQPASPAEPAFSEYADKLKKALEDNQETIRELSSLSVEQLANDEEKLVKLSKAVNDVQATFGSVNLEKFRKEVEDAVASSTELLKKLEPITDPQRIANIGQNFLKLIPKGAIETLKELGVLAQDFTGPAAFLPSGNISDDLSLQIQINEEAKKQLNFLNLMKKARDLIVDSDNRRNELAEIREKALRRERLGIENIEKAQNRVNNLIEQVDLEKRLKGQDEVTKTIERQVLAFKQYIDSLFISGDNAKKLADEYRKAATESAKLNDPRAREIATITDRFLGDVSTGLIEAIRNGESAMQALAQAFTNALEDQLKRLIEGIAQSIGEQFSKQFTAAQGKLIGGLVGVGAAVGLSVLARRDARGSTATEIPIEEIATSQTAVRGVVAGPQSVAIAEVGAGIREANRGVERLLERAVEELIKINASRSAGGLGAVGIS